jgi:hypothetical protein
LRKLPTISPRITALAIASAGVFLQQAARARSDHRRELEDRQVHADDHAADHDADEDHDERFEQAGQRIDRVVDFLLVELGGP